MAQLGWFAQSLVLRQVTLIALTNRWLDERDLINLYEPRAFAEQKRLQKLYEPPPASSPVIGSATYPLGKA